ncbi:hypothetical protein HK097_000375, partial [Rhizophlyctis rosea]
MQNRRYQPPQQAQQPSQQQQGQAQQGGKDLRKAKSAFVLSERNRRGGVAGQGQQQQNVGAGPVVVPTVQGGENVEGEKGIVLGSGKGAPRSINHHNGAVKTDGSGKNGGAEGGRVVGQKRSKVRLGQGFPPTSKEQEGSSPASGAEERRPLNKPSSRLFSKQVEEVNRAIGSGSGEGSVPSASPAPTSAATSSSGPKQPRNKKSTRSLSTTAPRDPSLSLGIYIYSFPPWIRAKDLLSLFSEFGEIVNVGIVAKPKNNDGRAYAYVDFETVGCAERAQKEVGGRKGVFGVEEGVEVRVRFDRMGRREGDVKDKAKDGEKVDAQKGEQNKDQEVQKGDEKKEEEVKKVDDKKKEEKKDEKTEVDYRTLHIANVPQHVDKAELTPLFIPHGPIRRLHLVSRPKEKRSFAFVSYRTPDSASKALAFITSTPVLGMSEPLKAEYSRVEKKNKKDATKSVGKGGRVLVLAKDIGKDGEAGLREKYPSLQKNLPLSGTSQSILVFTTAQDASKLVATRAHSSSFPRHRRIIVNDGLQGEGITIGESDVREFLSPTGDIRFVTSDTDGKWVVEFTKGDDAVKGLVKLLSTPFGGDGGVILGGGYAPGGRGKK